MQELISIAVLIATLYGGTLATEKIYVTVREAALTKAYHGLPRLAPFAAILTGPRDRSRFSPHLKAGPTEPNVPVKSSGTRLNIALQKGSPTSHK